MRRVQTEVPFLQPSRDVLNLCLGTIPVSSAVAAETDPIDRAGPKGTGWRRIDQITAAPRGREEFRIPGGNRPLPMVMGFDGYASRVRTERGKSYIKIYMIARHNEGRFFPQAKADRYRVSYSNVNSGDIVRILDGVCRIGHLSPFTLTRMSEPGLPDVSIASKRTYTIPFAGHARLHRRTITTADEHKTDEQGRPEITVLVVGRAPNHGRQRVREGDLLWIGRHAHRIEMIVASDPKRKLVGWCDINQNIAKTMD